MAGGPQSFSKPFGSFSFGPGDWTVTAEIGVSHNSTSVAFMVKEIPKPETYAMMLAGLGLLGWQVRRVRKQPQI